LIFPVWQNAPEGVFLSGAFFAFALRARAQVFGAAARFYACF